MTMRQRLGHLERQAAEGLGEAAPMTEVWLPHKPGCNPPGRYPLPGGNAAVVIYRPDEAPAAGAGEES